MGPSDAWSWEEREARRMLGVEEGAGAAGSAPRKLSNRGRVVHGYPAARVEDDALALLRREAEAGWVPSGSTLRALREANARAIDALAWGPEAEHYVEDMNTTGIPRRQAAEMGGIPYTTRRV